MLIPWLDVIKNGFLLQERECPNCGDNKINGAQLHCCLCYDMYHVACLDPIHAEKDDGKTDLLFFPLLGVEVMLVVIQCNVFTSVFFRHVVVFAVCKR